MEAIAYLISQEEGVLKCFLDIFFEKDTKVESDTTEWINIYQDPLELIDIITTVIDNNNTYKLDIMISIDKNLFVDVTQNNLDDVVKFILHRFYAPKVS